MTNISHTQLALIEHVNIRREAAHFLLRAVVELDAVVNKPGCKAMEVRHLINAIRENALTVIDQTDALEQKHDR